MAVIDLGTGGVDRAKEKPPAGRIIDLDTGGFVEPSGILGAAAGRKQQEAAAIQENLDQPTRATEELPEMTFSGLLSDAPVADVLKITPAILTATDPREIGNILSSNFPQIGITEDEKGNLIANNNDTGVQAVINKPGASPLDALQAIGIGSAFTPGASLAGATSGTFRKAIVGGSAAGLTQAGIEAVQQEAGGEFDADEMAIATALGGTAELVLPAIQAIRRTKLQKQADAAGQQIEDVKGSIETGQQATDATGIELFPAQKTTIPSELERQSFIPQLPAGTAKASQALARQNQQASQAVNEFLNSIAPPESIVTGSAKFRTAAQRAVDAKKTIRAERASPLYNRAFREGADVDLAPVNELIEAGLDEFPKGGQVFNSLAKIKKLIKTTPGDPIALKRLHNAKLEIDQMLNSFGDQSLGKTTKREVMQIKEELLTQMDNASQSYKDARKIFEASSPSVNKIQESIIGKVADIDDTQLKNISRRIFDPAETNPQVIRQAKKVIQDIDPDAWDELLRTELERRMGSVRSTLESGTTENVPGQLFNAIFGNTKQRGVLFNAVDGEAKRNLKFLETALKRASLGRQSGSQTAGRTEIVEELKGGFAHGLRNFFTSPISSTAGAASAAITGSTANAAFDSRVMALADVMFDPQWRPRVKELRKLPTDSPAAARAAFQLLDDALQADLKNIEDQ